MGTDLFSTLVSATGLPEEAIGGELRALLHKTGKTAETMTLDDLREVMAEYLQNVLLEAKEQYR